MKSRTRYILKFGKLDHATEYPFQTLSGAERKASTLLRGKQRRVRSQYRARIFHRINECERLVKAVTL